jgi:TatD DNase family protein
LKLRAWLQQQQFTRSQRGDDDTLPHGDGEAVHFAAAAGLTDVEAAARGALGDAIPLTRSFRKMRFELDATKLAGAARGFRVTVPESGRVVMAVASAAGASSAGLRLRFIDVGVNLTDPVFTGKHRGKQLHADDFDQVMARAKRHGVQTMLITGGNLEESRHAVALAKKHGLYCTVGCHPTRCNEFLQKAASPEAYLQALDDLIGQNLDVVRAVGECGLDYDRLFFCPADVQRRFFPLHFQLAAKYKLPLFLHNRTTGDDFCDILAQHREVVAECGGIVHSFTGDVGELRALSKLDGVYFSVNGCSMKTDENLRMISEIPLSRLMLETDAPWCDVRPTHASWSLRWPRPHEAPVAASAPKPKKGVASPSAVQAQPILPGSKAASLTRHAQQLLLPEERWVKEASKFEAGCMVRGRNEPACIVAVFEVLYALRAHEVESPVALADLIFSTTSAVLKIG